VLSWNFGVSDGAKAVNITPARSRAWVCYRPMPGVSGQDLIDLVDERCQELGIEFETLSGSGPLWTDPDDEHVQTLCELTGTSPRTVCFGTDGGLLTELQHRVVCGPGDIAQAHTHDEWISMQQVRRGIDLYHRCIKQWCVD